MYDVVASVVPLAAALVLKGLVPERCCLFVRCVATVATATPTKEVSTTEPVPAIGDLNRWFVVALRLPEFTSDVVVSVCVTSGDGSAGNFQEIATATVDLQALFTEKRLRVLIDPATSSELKLVLCARDALSPFEMNKTLINPMFTSYAFPNRNSILREIVGECPFGYIVPGQFLDLQLFRLAETISEYSALLQRVRIKQGLFTDDVEAVKHFFYPCSVRIVGIRSLEQTHRVPGSKSMSSPFVSVSINCKHNGEVKQVGRTNTEYRTADPVFGTNANIQLAEHNNPVREFEPGRFGRITPDGAWMECYLQESDSLRFTVFHERHSVYQGVTNHAMCTAEIPFQQLADMPNSVKEIDLRDVNDPSRTGGKLYVVAMLKEKPPNNPFDFLASSENNLAALTMNDTASHLSRIPSYWLAQLIQKMKANFEGLNIMRQEIEQRVQCDANRCFKSSMDKKKFALGAITTNLHQCDFSVASTIPPGETRSRFAYTTCGVPSALALGVSDLNSSILVRKDVLRRALRSVNLKTEQDLNINSGFGISEPGTEVPLLQCPHHPSCSKPVLNMDDTCGSSFHRQRTSTTRNRTASSTVRSAAASIASRFTSPVGAASPSANPHGTPSQPSGKAFSPVPWQHALELQCDIFYRQSVAVSQALAPTASVFMSELQLNLWRGAQDAAAFGEQLIKAGFLIGWESLISTHGAEMCMLSDVIGVVEFLNTSCQLVCRPSRSSEWGVSIESCDRSNGQGVTIVVYMPKDELGQVFRSLPVSQQEVPVALTVVLFSQGVNETQSISNFMNKEWASKQAEINRVSIQLLVQYALKLHKTLPLPVLRLNSIVQNQREDEKEVDVLLMGEDAVRALRGGRQIMCKSGKDRTAMAVTLEQSRNGSSNESIRDIANLMREFGARIRVAEKNVGNKLYSFNVIQRMALPVDYRPPVSVIQDMATSYSKKDS